MEENIFKNACKMAAIFKFSLLCDKWCILVEISLKFIPIVSINNKLALVQIMACHQTGNKPLC